MRPLHTLNNAVWAARSQAENDALHALLSLHLRHMEEEKALLDSNPEKKTRRTRKAKQAEAETAVALKPVRRTSKKAEAEKTEQRKARRVARKEKRVAEAAKAERAAARKAKQQ